MNKLVAVFLALPTLSFAVEEHPWYPEVFEFNFLGRYEYNFFDKVDNGVPKLDHTFHTHVVSGGLELTAPETWNYQIELEFADTSSVSFGYRSFAIQVRKLWLDDVAGDPISLSTGIVYRDASKRLRKALSTPYHGQANFEFHTALGKEWSSGRYFVFRTYAIGAVGQATSGDPWLRGDLYFWWNYYDRYQFRLYGKSYWGLGDKTAVPTIDFDGWGDIRHQSIDLGASYWICLGIWGSFQCDYNYRVYAHSYPEQVHFFLFTIKIPFSVL